MVSSAAGALTDELAAVVVSARQIRTPANASKISIEDKIHTVEEHIARVTNLSRLSASDRSKLDSVGTELWNACRTQVMEASQHDKQIIAMNSKMLVVTVALLDLASPINAPGHIRILELAFEAARVCMDTTALDYALKILKVAAKRLDLLEGLASAIDQSQIDSISAEYYMLRVHLAWQQGRPDIADHLFTKVPLRSKLKNRSVIVGECLCIGRSAVEAGQYDAALKWLEVALDQLQENPKDQGLNSGNLHLHVRHALTWAYMRTDTPEAAEKLEEQMTALKTKYGGDSVVQLLELEIIRRMEKPDSDQFFQVLGAIVVGLDHTEECLNVVLGYIKYSMRLSIGLAFEMYQSLLKSLPYGKPEWVEECFLRLPLMVNSMSCELEFPHELSTVVMKDALACLEARGFESVSQEATHVFFTILLNMYGDPRTPSHRHVAENWCHLTLGAAIFKDCYKSVSFSLQKRLATFCFDNNSVALARQILEHIYAENGISESDPEIQCLAFKLALHDGKDINLKTYLCGLSSHTSHSDQLDFLRSWAVEAGRMNNSKVVIDCVQEFMTLTRNLESTQEGFAVEVGSDSAKPLSMADSYFFPLSILSAELGRVQTSTEDDIFHLAYSVLKWAKRGLNTTDSDFSIHELESVCMDSYNLTLHIFSTFPPESAREALENTKEIIDLSRQRAQSIQTENHKFMLSNRQEGRTEKKMRSPELGYIAYQFLYLEVSIRVFCVQSQTDPQVKLEQYTKISTAIRSIRDQVPLYLECHPLDTDTLRNLSANEFVAAVALKQWSAVATILRDSEDIYDATLFDHFINCILSFEMPDAHRVVFLNTILEIIRGAGTGIPIDLDHLSPYYHHLFTFALATAQSERTTQLPDLSQEWPHAYHDMAESVIDEVLKAASGVSDLYKECRDGDLPAGESSLPETDQLAYPISELRYLAASSFNQAMDFYSAENDRACLRWARKAVLLAESMGTPEGEELVSLFQSRLKALF